MGRDLDRARQDIGGLSLDAIAEAGGLRGAVGPAIDAVNRAESRADHPLLDPLTAVPVVGDQVEGLRSITDRVSVVAAAGEDALDRIEDGLADTDEPSDRIELVEAAIDALDDVDAAIVALAPAGDDGLLGPLRSASDELDEELAEAPADIAELRDRMVTARDILVGPTKILLLASNNAEMRAGMGMHLSAGLLTVEGGGFESSGFVSTLALTRVTPERADVPAELEAMFGEIWDFGREWRTVSTTPDFPTVGDIFGQLAAMTEIGEVDMVVSMDVPALARLLDATGPVQVSEEGLEETVTADNVVELLLRDNYLELGEEEEAAERRELQSRIAGTIFDTVTERAVDVLDLAAELSDAAAGRHLMGWSADAGVQDLWESIGADGALTADSFLVAAQNATSSKRDYYLDPEVRLETLETLEGGARRVRASLELHNPEVRPTAPYVDSLNPFVPVGVHRAYVTFHLPGSATDLEVVAGNQSRLGTDGPTEVAAVWIRVPVTGTRTAAVQFTLPADQRTVEIVPHGRIRPVVHHIGRTTVLDTAAPQVLVPRGRELPHEANLWAALSLVFLFSALLVVVGRLRRLERPEPDLAAARTDALVATALVAVALALAVLAAV